MSAHTPGPWRIEWYVCRDNGKELWRVPRRIGPVSVDNNHWAGNHLDVSPQDASVIAAAPELLSALQNILRWMPVYPKAAEGIVGGKEAHAASISAAHAAIAKATGGTA